MTDPTNAIGGMSLVRKEVWTLLDHFCTGMAVYDNTDLEHVAM